jgi:hypothetical protein
VSRRVIDRKGEVYLWHDHDVLIVVTRKAFHRWEIMYLDGDRAGELEEFSDSWFSFHYLKLRMQQVHAPTQR